MALEQLTFANLTKVDHGAVGVAVDHALSQVYRDIIDREALKKIRKVTLEIELRPECDQKGNLTHVDAGFSVKTTMPAKSTAIVMNANGQGLQFQTDSPQNPNQHTLDFDRAEGDEEE